MLYEQRDEQTPYERLLEDALAGNGALFTREDCLEVAWAVVEPVLERHQPAQPYEFGRWGPEAANMLITQGAGWHNPTQEAPE